MAENTGNSGGSLWDGFKKAAGEGVSDGIRNRLSNRKSNRENKSSVGERVKGGFGSIGEKARGVGRSIGDTSKRVSSGVGGVYQRGPGEIFRFSFRNALKFLGWFIFLIIIALVVLFVWRNVVTGDLEKSVLENIYEPLANSNLWLTMKQGYNTFLNPVSPQEIWSGEVDDHVDTKLGIYVNRFEPYQREFTEEDDIILFADIDVYGFPDTVEELRTLRVGCELNGKEGEVIPMGEYRILPYESYSPECKFGSYNEISDPENPIGRSSIASLNVDYDFNTKGYLKVYFMDDKEKRSLLSKGVEDVFGYYKLNEVSPVKSVYTNGPIEVALSVGSGERIQPIGLVKGENKKFLGITVNNKWDGKIKRINSLKLVLPEGVSLDEGDTCPFERNGDEYLMSFDEEIDTFKTFRCYVDVDYGILEGKSLKQDYYQFEAEYEYGAEKKAVVVFMVEDEGLGDFDLDGLNLPGIGGGKQLSTNEYKKIYGDCKSDSAYVSNYLTSINFMGKSVSVNKKVKDQFLKVQEDIKKCNVNYNWNSVETYSCRTIAGSSTMSLHSFGIAMDINAGNNPDCKLSGGNVVSGMYDPKGLCGSTSTYCRNIKGCVCDLSSCVIDSFRNNGFKWGCEYNSHKDAMHFEYLG